MSHDSAAPIATTDDRPALERRIRALIRDVPDFPKPGIVFKDITPLLGDGAAFRAVCEALASPYRGSGITHVAAIESRGFIFGAPVAQILGAGFVPVRKVGKLPFTTSRVEYALEYGTDALEVHLDACPPPARVLVVDDVLATGGTADATCRLVEQIGGEVVGCAFVIALDFLGGSARLTGRSIGALVHY
jgi:adenine phosphoribosyltransferase